MSKKKNSQKDQLLLRLTGWISDAKSMQNPEEYRQFFDRIFKDYLISPAANDLKYRSKALVVFNHLNDLINILDVPEEHFDVLDKWIQKKKSKVSNTSEA